MIWKVKAIEAYPVEGDDTEYEFEVPPRVWPADSQVQILDFTPEMEMPVDDGEGGICWEERPAVVVCAYPDRGSD